MGNNVRTDYRKHHGLSFADEEIFDEIVGSVKRARENLKEKNKNDFRKVLSECLRLYVEIVRDTVKDEDIVNKVENSCKYLKNIVKSVHEGLHSRAFRQLQNYLTDIEQWLYCDVGEEKYFYRMRVCKKRKDLTRKDIFHVPLDSIRKIATRRYSAPGYPCLYLANSIYGCWEEMGRPNTEETLISCFSNKEKLKLVDLRIPSCRQFIESSEKYAILFPLILSCSVPVDNPDDVYKPEYSLPQLMLEWVITYSRFTGAIGIYYTSVYKNDDFFCSLHEEWDNIAIPVLSPLSSKKFCPKLEGMFDLTLPTCYEYEKLKGNFDTFDKCGTSRDEEYNRSLFSKLERLLQQKNFSNANSEELD